MSRGWAKAFIRRNWMNRPSTKTPINAQNLNVGDLGLDTIDDRVLVLDTVKAEQSDLLTVVKSVTLNATNGVLTVTLVNGTTTTYDTLLDKIAVNFDFDDNPSSAHYQNLVITLDDGTVKYVDMSSLITQYEFVDSSTIIHSVDSNGKVTAKIKAGSIGSGLLNPDYLAQINTKVAAATSAASAADGYANDASYEAKLAKSYAIGDETTRQGSSTDNAKYYKEQAEVAARDASYVNVTRTNLLNPTAQTQTIGGVTFTNNGDGTYTINGTSTDRLYFEFYFGDANFLKVGETYKYIVKIPNQSGILDQIYYWDNGSYSANFVNGVFEYNSSHQKVLIRIQVAGNATFNNVILKPMLTTDLSATYNDFVGYSGDGELNENVAEIYAAEDALQNEGYKYPTINGIKNYTDSNGVYHKNLGVVDLGTLGWAYVPQYNYFYVNIPTIKIRTNNIECARYQAYDSNLSASNLPNMGIKLSADNKPIVFIKNTTYTDATTLKNAMSGVLLFYELETPQTWNSKSEISRVSDETYTNLLNPTAQTQIYKGVTLANNGDGTYTLNGTATDTIYFALQQNFNISAGTYRLNCCASPSYGGKYCYLQTSDNTLLIDDVVGIATIPNSSNCKFVLRIASGQVLTNEVIKPMLTTKLDATYDDFIPYSGSGALNENVQKIYSDLSESQQVLTGTLVSGNNYVWPTGTFTLKNCYIAKVDYMESGKWRDATTAGVQPWVDITNGINIYGSSAMPSNLVGLPFRCILRKL